MGLFLRRPSIPAEEEAGGKKGGGGGRKRNTAEFPIKARPKEGGERKKEARRGGGL